jgi:hypothetical protein
MKVALYFKLPVFNISLWGYDTVYSLVGRYQHFGGTQPSSSGSKSRPSKKPAEAGSKLRNPAEIGNMLLSNVGPYHTTWHYNSEAYRLLTTM